MDDRWKRGIMLFKTVLDLSRYDFQFPRYRCVKKRVIFNSSIISVLFARFNQSLPPPPHHSTQCILETLLHSIKIRKTLNRCNSGRIDFCSTNEIRLEAWNFALCLILFPILLHTHISCLHILVYFDINLALVNCELPNVMMNISIIINMTSK